MSSVLQKAEKFVAYRQRASVSNTCFKRRSKITLSYLYRIYSCQQFYWSKAMLRLDVLKLENITHIRYILPKSTRMQTFVRKWWSDVTMCCHWTYSCRGSCFLFKWHNYGFWKLTLDTVNLRADINQQQNISAIPCWTLFLLF